MRFTLILNSLIRKVSVLHYSNNCFKTRINSKFIFEKSFYSSFIGMKRSFSTMSGFTFDEPVTIGTHDGVFHCDELLACYLLRKIPQLKTAEIIRSRDPKILEKCSIIVDVGGHYDPERHRYDHHQRDFMYTLSSIHPEYPDKQIKLSSAGLIYAHFGKEILQQFLNNPELTDEDLKLIYLTVYESFIEEIDGIDNGIPQYKEGSARYRINSHISGRIHKLNPEWNSPADVDVQELFNKGMALVGKEFEETVLHVTNIWLPGRVSVREAIEKRFSVHKSGEIIELVNRCPWKEHFFSLERELGLKNDIKFVIFMDTNKNWRVQGVPTEPNSFICRVFLRDDWMGLRDEVLSNTSGIPNCMFVHASGFIGGNKDRNGALAMAIESLEYSKIE